MGSARPCKWTDRGGGSHWASCDVGGQEGVVATVLDEFGRVSIAAIVQIDAANALDVDDAKREVESWLDKTRALKATLG